MLDFVTSTLERVTKTLDESGPLTPQLLEALDVAASYLKAVAEGFELRAIRR